MWEPGKSLSFNRNPTYHECYYTTELSKDEKEAAQDRELGFDKPGLAHAKLPIADWSQN